MPCNQRAQWGSLNPRRKAKVLVTARKRIKLGSRYFYPKTIEQTRMLRAHIRSRLNAFKRRQAGTQT